MNMQIIGGIYKGKKLISPKSENVRPTASRSREALFNMLETHTSLKGKNVADLYCGSGALGLEAISRGAAKAIFADIDTKPAFKNAQSMQVENQVSYVQADVLKFSTEKLAEVDIIFMDPPYGYDLAAKTIEAHAPHLKKGTIWAIEVEADHPLAALPFAAKGTPLKLLGKNTHGAASIAIFVQ